MSRNSRRSQRHAVSVQRNRQKNWLRRYLRALKNGVAAASIGAASIGAVELMSQPAAAATKTWIGNTSVNWADAANWSGGTVPATGDSLQFGAAGTAGTTLVDNLMFPALYTLSDITFTAAAPTYTINNSSGTRGFNFNTGTITDQTAALENLNDNIVISTALTATMSNGGTLALGGVISGPGTLTTAGNGTLALSGNSSFSGGVTLGGGNLNIGRATALGTGALTISTSATIDNTSGNALTLSTNNALNINADLTFTGTNNLNFGTGTVTLGGAAGVRNFNINGTLTLGPIFSATASGVGLSVNSGTLSIVPANNGNGAAVVSVVDGNLNVAGGARLNAGQDDTFFGNLSGAGTIANGSNTTRWITVGSNNQNSTF